MNFWNIKTFLPQEKITLAVFGKTFRNFGHQCSSTSYFIWPFELFWIRADSLMSLLKTKRASGVITKCNPAINDEFICTHHIFLYLFSICLVGPFMMKVTSKKLVRFWLIKKILTHYKCMTNAVKSLLFIGYQFSRISFVHGK